MSAGAVPVHAGARTDLAGGGQRLDDAGLADPGVGDVAGHGVHAQVDIRRGSPTFGKSAGFVLSAENKRMAWIPPGFAHGFLSLEDGTTVLYKASDFYAPAHERSLLWSDPVLGIEWPLDQVGGLSAVLVSDKDKIGKPLAEADVYAEGQP